MKSSGRSKFIFPSLIVILFLCVLASINEVRIENFLELGRCALVGNYSSEMRILSSNNQSLETTPSASSSSSLSSEDDIRVLIGILTLPDQYQKRHFLRLIYGAQRVEGARVDVKFVFCNLTKEDQMVFVALEIMQYDDIIILDCQENMNKGKTYTFFSSLPEMLNTSDGPYPPYHYVMKGDDDIYLRVNNLVKSLKPLPREDLYYGYVIPCESMDPFRHYMAGMGYLISWDIVEWIRVSEIPKNHLQGPEDKVFGDWMREGRKGRNRHNAKWAMYDFPKPETKCTHELSPDTIAVHKLKNPEKWRETLIYFNVTNNLRPSKLYHIP